MGYTKQEFAREANDLVAALDWVKDGDETNTTTTTTTTTPSLRSVDSASSTLYQWKIAGDDTDNRSSVGQTVYLVHPPIVRHSDSSVSTGEELQRSNELVLDKEIANRAPLQDEFLFEDDTVEIDADTLLLPLPYSPGATEWNFSIVYSDTWRVPVLYFTVQRLLDRSHYLRTEVLKAFNGTDQGTVGDDSWDFLSQEEHPITGIPSFFLHPCQTAERLELLLQAAVNANNDANPQMASAPLLLLGWMSMIFPAVGIQISLETFALVQRRISEGNL